MAVCLNLDITRMSIAAVTAIGWPKWDGEAKQARNASQASEVNQAGSESKAIEKAKRSKHEGKH